MELRSKLGKKERKLPELAHRPTSLVAVAESSSSEVRERPAMFSDDDDVVRDDKLLLLLLNNIQNFHHVDDSRPVSLSDDSSFTIKTFEETMHLSLPAVFWLAAPAATLA